MNKKDIQTRDSIFTARKIADYIMEKYRNIRSSITNSYIRHIGEELLGSDISNRTIENVKRILRKHDTIQLLDCKKVRDKFLNKEEAMYELLQDVYKGIGWTSVEYAIDSLKYDSVDVDYEEFIEYAESQGWRLHKIDNEDILSQQPLKSTKRMYYSEMGEEVPEEEQLKEYRITNSSIDKILSHLNKNFKGWELKGGKRRASPYTNDDYWIILAPKTKEFEWLEMYQPVMVRDSIEVEDSEDVYILTKDNYKAVTKEQALYHGRSYGLQQVFRVNKNEFDSLVKTARQSRIENPNRWAFNKLALSRKTKAFDSKKVRDSIQDKEYQYLLKILTDSFSDYDVEPFLYDGLSEYQDFLSLYEIVEGEQELPNKPLIVLTYLYNELEDEKDNWDTRLETDKKRLEHYDLKVFNSPEPEDAKYLVIGLKGEKINLPLEDSKLTRKHKLWYAEKMEDIIDPKLLKRNYRVKQTKNKGKRRNK